MGARREPTVPLQPTRRDLQLIGPAGVGPARENFLSGKEVELSLVRQPILASWQRSSDWAVSCDNLSTPYEEDLDMQGRMMRAATVVLDQLLAQLVDQPVSIILTDNKGFVLTRRTGRRVLESRLDEVFLAPGFSYAEQFVGTNGIGTTLEAGEPAFVYEEEHFAGPLVDLACAGVPIHNPITGVVEGVLDITCLVEDSSPLLMAMAVGAAHSIEARLLEQGRGQEMALLQEYLGATRRCTDPVLALSDDLLMVNDHARALLTTQDQALLVDHLHAERASRRPVPAEFDLPSGARCRVHIKNVGDQARRFGAVARIQFTQSTAPRGLPATATTTQLPGIVGSGGLWTQCCRKLDRLFQERNWGLVEGETGVGKLAVVRAVHLYHRPAEPFRVITLSERGEGPDAYAEILRELTTGTGTLVLRHLDRADAAALGHLERGLRAISGTADAPWVVATMGSNAVRGPALDRVLGFFPRSVEVPPLRHHIDDVEPIAEMMLRQSTKRPEAMFSRAAMRVLMRANWPGNIAQLRQTIQTLAGRTRSGIVSLEDLPPSCYSQTKRILTPMESMERDAIVDGLAEANGNRAKAARALGISRATIYRKMKDYGIGISS